MQSETDFDASWSGLLIGISIGASALLIAVAVLGSLMLGPQSEPLFSLAILLPLVVLAGSWLFCVRGYEICGQELLVRRLLWTTRVALDGLHGVEVEPGALRSSLRVFGNGGLFSFSGLFYNKTLGMYHAFVTAPKNTVILSWPERRSVAVSPDRPERFVGALRRLYGLG